MRYVAALLLAVVGDPGTVPDVSGPCQYGMIQQRGAAVAITGNYWQATGEWVGDRLVLHWFGGNDLSVGVYRLKGKKLVGKWAHLGTEQWSGGDLENGCADTIVRGGQ